MSLKRNFPMPNLTFPEAAVSSPYQAAHSDGTTKKQPKLSKRQGFRGRVGDPVLDSYGPAVPVRWYQLNTFNSRSAGSSPRLPRETVTHYPPVDRWHNMGWDFENKAYSPDTVNSEDSEFSRNLYGFDSPQLPSITGINRNLKDEAQLETSAVLSVHHLAFDRESLQLEGSEANEDGNEPRITAPVAADLQLVTSDKQTGTSPAFPINNSQKPDVLPSSIDNIVRADPEEGISNGSVPETQRSEGVGAPKSLSGSEKDKRGEPEIQTPVDEDAIELDSEELNEYSTPRWSVSEGPPSIVDVSAEDEKWLNWAETQFQQIAGEDGEIDLAEFKAALKVKKSFFAERFFSLFDQDGSGSIDVPELMDGLRMLTKGSPAQKLRFLFDVYDVDGSGTIDREELKLVLTSCMEESSLQISDENIQKLTDVLFNAADDDSSGAITFEELKAELEKHPGVLENLTISAANWLKPPSDEKVKKSLIPRHLTLKYTRNNLRKVIFFWFYWIINFITFFFAAYKHKEANYFVIFARGCGMCLNLNCTLVLVLMLRKSLTFIRTTRLAEYLPIDQHIMFHKMIGIVIGIYSLVHTGCHVGNVLILVAEKKEYTVWEYVFTLKPNLGGFYGMAPVTGVVLDVILIIMIICSMPFVRRTGHFKVFYWTHLLYIPFWVLVIFHAPNFWKFFVVPGFVFLIEFISRARIVKRAQFGNVKIIKVNLLPSKVTHVMIARPKRFSYEPGDYLFIQIPDVASNEWHPFTISSAPENQDEVWLHIRSVGHWTNKLYEYFDTYEANMQLKELKRAQSAGLAACTGSQKESVEGLTIRNLVQVPGASQKKRKSDWYYEAYPGLKGVVVGKGFAEVDMEKADDLPEKGHLKRVNTLCYIDGPFGTSTREIFETEHAVLVGAGIGVTPYASILQSVMARYKNAKVECPSCSHQWLTNGTNMGMKIKKLDFIWINRDQKSFEWFVSLLMQLEKEQEEVGSFGKLIEMHMYMTAALGKTDMKAIGLQIALDMLHEQGGVDLVTGLQTKTIPGRPNWDEIFTKIKEEGVGKVKVFFCGSPALGKDLKESSGKFGFGFCKENF